MFLERSGEMANIFQKLIPYRSPLELLSEHSKLCVKAANLMYTAVEKYLNNTSVDDLSKEVDALEQAADQLKLQLRNIYIANSNGHILIRQIFLTYSITWILLSI
jgi:hypothetical protein